MWGWNYHDGMINFPDYQSRLYKNLPHIRYERRLHEKVEGYKSYAFIPPQKDIALISFRQCLNTNFGNVQAARRKKFLSQMK